MDLKADNLNLIVGRMSMDGAAAMAVRRSDAATDAMLDEVWGSVGAGRSGEDGRATGRAAGDELGRVD